MISEPCPARCGRTRLTHGVYGYRWTTGGPVTVTCEPCAAWRRHEEPQPVINPQEWEEHRRGYAGRRDNYLFKDAVVVWVLIELAREGRLILAPKPTPTVLVELSRHDAQLYSEVNRDDLYSRRHRLAAACRTALDGA